MAVAVNSSEPALIYAHIPKSAGSSFRHLVWDNYDRKNVFWYGIDTPRGQWKVVLDDLIGYHAVGGHFKLQDFKGAFQSSLRAAVVRDPVSRAISLFHYYSAICPENQRENWLSWGLDPSDMRRTLIECPAFLGQVKNQQCRILSGSACFKEARKEVSKPNMILGVYDKLDEFVEAVSSKLSWRHRSLQQLNPGKSGYYEKIASDQSLIDELVRLNSDDLALYRWLQEEHVIVYVAQPEQFQAMVTGKVDKDKTEYTKEILSRVRIIVDGDTKVEAVAGEGLRVPVDIINKSQKVLNARGPHPITLGAHWLNPDGSMRIHEAGRCRFRRSVGPGEVLEVDFNVMVPESLAAGKYVLSICLVHKGVGWLHQGAGLRVGKLEVTVVGAAGSEAPTYTRLRKPTSACE